MILQEKATCPDLFSEKKKDIIYTPLLFRLDLRFQGITFSAHLTLSFFRDAL